jgi:paraquat-inducible protein B
MATNQEKITTNPENNLEAARELGQQQSEVLRENHEKAGEHSPEKAAANGERARADALENAISVEKKGLSKEKGPLPSPAARRGAITKRELDATYKRTMKQVQSELSTPSRAFSKVIHVKAVEKTSEALESTVARPNAILAGAIAAFIFTLAIYLIAKNFGYRLSGFETIGGFILGWIVGLLFDYFRVMITGKHS